MVTKPLVHDLIVEEVSSHTARMVPVHSTTLFSIKGLEKSLHDFTGTIFAACVNSYCVIEQEPFLSGENPFLHVPRCKHI